MMRLLFLCLLLPTATAYSEETEGSANDDVDDEDLFNRKIIPEVYGSSTDTDRATGEDNDSDQLTMIIIIVAVVVLTLSVAAIVVIFLVRRRMHKRQQGIYSVPTEQDKKEAV